MTGRLARAAAAAAVVAALAETVIVVEPAQVAVVYRLGAPHRVAQAGLAFRLPRPLERDERILASEVRRVELPRRRFLTGDHNLVDLALVAQYAVSDPVAYATRAAEPEAVIGSEVVAAATSVVGSMEVDALLTTGRPGMQARVLQEGQRQLDAVGAGVRLVAVDAREIVPPAPVVDAFNDVSSARGDRETIALAADAYVSQVLPDARGQASKRLEDARGEASRVRATAQGRVARFQRLLPEHRAQPEATRRQLHRDMLREVAPRLDVRVVPPGSEVYLPGGTP